MTKVLIIDANGKQPNVVLPSNIQKHCNQYKDDKLKQTSLLAWKSLGKYIDLTKVKFNENSKPYIPGNKICFSLSHSLDVIALAISNKPIGIDVETIMPLPIVRQLAQRLLNKKQLSLYYKAKDNCVWFAKYWTQHEAYIKLKGNSISLANFKKNLKCSIETRQIKKNNRIYFVSVAQKK